MIGNLTEARSREKNKYVHVYSAMDNYRMGDQRRNDAEDDLLWGMRSGCKSYLDIGCGRGEMLRYARAAGFSKVEGTEIVPELCRGRDVHELAIHELAALPDNSFGMVSSFDVIEHVLPGDDALLISEMGRLARTCIAWTANNNASIDPTTGADLHINKKPYEIWDAMFKQILEPTWRVQRIAGKRYVSATWQAWRPGTYLDA